MKFKEYLSKLYKNITPRLEEGKVTVCSAVMLLSIGVIIYVLLGYEPASDKWLNRLLAIYTVIGGGGLVALSCFWKKFAEKIGEYPADVARVMANIELEKGVFIDAALEDIEWANQILSPLKGFSFVRQESEHSKIFKEYYMRCKAIIIFCNNVPNPTNWVLTRLRENERIKIRRGQPLKIAVYTNKDDCVPPQVTIPQEVTILRDAKTLEDWLESLPQNQST